MQSALSGCTAALIVFTDYALVTELVGVIHCDSSTRTTDMQVRGTIEFTIVEKKEGHVLAEMPIQPGILNPFGVVNAGAILWFADVAASVLLMDAGHEHAGMSGFPLAINLNANLIGNQREGVFTARAELVKRGRTVSLVHTQVRGAGDKLIADLTSNHVLSK